MSFFHEPEKASCKVYEGKTCIPSIRAFVIHHCPETDNIWRDKLLKDLDEMEERKYLVKGNGQIGIQIDRDGRLIDYTWSFGQKTKRRLSVWCRGRLYNANGGIVIAARIDSPTWVIREDCLKQPLDDSVEEE
tara:strand:+ start:16397 stop:16795 length:399 start_codon:yes stop_codon:yes gene_type:complete